MKNVLIVSGHPDLSVSFANKTILAELERLLPQAEVVRLDALYPEYKVDVKAEQERLLRADVIVWQFPVQWYGTPSLLHKWMEQVLSFGFAYGDGGEGKRGDKLKGKRLLLSFTSGSPETMYRYGGGQGYPIEDYLPRYKQTAVLCGLEWMGYVYSGGYSYLVLSDEKKRKEAEAQAKEHAERVAERVEML